MSHSDFFADDRTIDSFEISLHDGKATLKCVVVERWEEIISRPLVCGTEFEYEVTQRYGVRTTEREDIEATISASLGLKGIAEFKSEIKAKTGRELQLEETHEVREKTKFKAPECGRLTVLIYQLKRLYRFSYRDARYFHRDSWTKTVTEWVSRIHDASKASKNDPGCGCDAGYEAGIDGQCQMNLGKVSMILGYAQRREGPFMYATDFLFPQGDPAYTVTYRSAKKFSGLGTINIHRKYIPPHLLFLARESAEILHGTLYPYSEGDETDQPTQAPRGDAARLGAALVGRAPDRPAERQADDLLKLR